MSDRQRMIWEIELDMLNQYLREPDSEFRQRFMWGTLGGFIFSLGGLAFLCGLPFGGLWFIFGFLIGWFSES